MSDRKKRKLQQTVWGNISSQRRAAISSNLGQREKFAPPPTVPAIKAPTLAEIEAKYGK